MHSATRKSNLQTAISQATLSALALLGALVLAASQPAQAQTETVLYSFGTQSGDGNYPYAGLAVGAKGNFYGTTNEGGANDHGTVFKVTSKGAETVLYSFCSQPSCTDGSEPYFSGAVLDKAGNFYGTTPYGGAFGSGTVFKVTPAGSETVLYSFAGGADGSHPYNGLLLDKSGNLYGMTYEGGAYGYGTVFKVTPSGTETVLYSFAGGTTDGCNPYGASLALGKKNVLYGTTSGCGASRVGTVFKVAQTGVETILHSFNNSSTDGANPNVGVVLDKMGNLYGTTLNGGAHGGGTVFEITASGTESLLYSFCSQADCADGQNPYGAGVVLDKSGNLYGTTLYGGPYEGGTVFEITASGTESVLHSFNPETDGVYPYAGVVLKSGKLYGTTSQGGTGAVGTVFKVVP